MKRFLKDKLRISTLGLRREDIWEFLVFLFLIFLAYSIREVPPSKPHLVGPSQGMSSQRTSNLFSNQTLLNATFPAYSNTTSNATSKVILTYTHLNKRNPFTPEGSYFSQPIPEDPFTLIAVRLTPPPPTAVIRVFTGELLTVKKGDKLLDGAKVVEIKENSLILERLGKKRELKILSVEVEKWKPKKPF